MSLAYITIAKAAEVLGVSKRTLFRWDKEGRFNPTSREQVSKIRLYSEKDIQNLKVVLNHERRFRKNIKGWKKIQDELNIYESVFLMSDREMELLKEEEKFRVRHKSLIDEFKAYSPEVKQMHKKFFKI